MTRIIGTTNISFVINFGLLVMVTYVTSCILKNALEFRRPLSSKDRLVITKDMIGNSDKSADNIIKIMQSAAKGREPYALENVTQCSICYLYGLHTVKRTGNFTVHEVDDLKRVQGNFGFENVTGTCNCSIGFLVYAHGDLDFQLHDFSFYVDIQLNYTDDYTVDARITELKVTNKGVLFAIFRSKGVVGWIFAKFTRVFHLTFLAKIRYLLYQKIAELLDKNKDYLGTF